MPITIEDACDILRGRVRRLAGRDGQRRLLRIAKEMRISSPTLLAFLNDNEDSNLTTKTLHLIQHWCDQEEQLLEKEEKAAVTHE
jgi:hypothetical protein